LLINKEKKNSDEIALLGNSNAQMYGYAFENILHQLNINGSILALDGCLPTLEEAEDYEYCAKVIKLKELVPTIKFTRKKLKKSIVDAITEL
jgi:hypothetical protein